MFPIREPALSFLKISQYWSGEIHPPKSQNDLLKDLEGAWWLGEIHGDSALSRIELLKRMFKSMQHRDDLGIVFVVGEGASEPRYKEFPDGSMLVRVQIEVHVPSGDIDTWEENCCDEAFQALAQTSSIESYPEITPGLAFIKVSHDEFFPWLAKHGFHKPTFWRPCGAEEKCNATSQSEAAQERPPKSVTPKVAKEFVEKYVASEHKPTQKGAVAAAQKAGLRGGRELIRQAFKQKLGLDAPGRGRPKKTNKSPKK
jgi:hypothetical protein